VPPHVRRRCRFEAVQAVVGHRTAAHVRGQQVGNGGNVGAGVVAVLVVAHAAGIGRLQRQAALLETV